MSAPDEIDFTEVLRALLDQEHPLPARYLHRLSDLESFELESLQRTWPDIALWRRQALMEDVEELCKADYLVSFESLGDFATRDPDPLVRLRAVRTLWEFENKNLIPTLVRLLKNDPDVEVRAASASALGQYVYLGEIEAIPAKISTEVEALLLEIIQGNEEDSIRRSALESLGFSSRKEVPALIEEAYESGDPAWIGSALFAMGRSGNEIWAEPVLSMLEHRQPDTRYEAARAAGELEIAEAIPLLLELLDDPSDSVRDASIWSLSQIGGEGVREKLEQMFEEAQDDEQIDYLESALDNLAFTEGMQLMPLLDYPESETDEEPDEVEEDDLFILDDDEDLED